MANDGSALDALRSALAHHRAERLDEAEDAYRAAAEAGIGDEPIRRLVAAFFVARGKAAAESGRLTDAADRYRLAVTLSADAETLLLLGDVLSKLGEIDTAIDALRRAVAADPGLIAAHRMLAAAGVPESIVTLRAVWERPDVARDERAAIGFALAGLLDRENQFDEAFAYLETANTLTRTLLREAGRIYDRTAQRRYIDEHMFTFDAAFFERMAGSGNPSRAPVFVVGMPRSGTTLVEQILASHPRAFGIGEGHWIGALATELGGGPWDRAIVRRVADGHIAALDRLSGGQTRVIDKTPDNLFHLGLIAALFPGARVILCRRDPLDICLSCYFQSFADPMPYAYDLLDCGGRLLEAERMAAHWRRVLPIPMLTIDYEALVADQEAETRRILDFVGLDWDPTCLDFHATRRVVRSASLWQVRRPLYAGSVGRWRHYARHLLPLRRLLGGDQPA